MNNHHLLARNKTALIVVDVQGKLARSVSGSSDVIGRIQTLVKCAKLMALPIIWLEQYPQGLGRTVEEIAEIMPDIPVLEKTHFNAMSEATIARAICATHAEHYLVCGIEAHVCVYQTVAGLVETGFEVSTVEDACSSRFDSDKAMGIQRMRDIGVHIRSTEMAIFELIGDASDPIFKQILPLIK